MRLRLLAVALTGALFVGGCSTEPALTSDQAACAETSPVLDEVVALYGAYFNNGSGLDDLVKKLDLLKNRLISFKTRAVDPELSVAADELSSEITAVAFAAGAARNSADGKYPMKLTSRLDQLNAVAAGWSGACTTL